MGKLFGVGDGSIESPKNSRTNGYFVNCEVKNCAQRETTNSLKQFGAQTADRRIGRIVFLTGLFKAVSYVHLPCCQL